MFRHRYVGNTLLVAVFALGIGGAAPVLAANIAGTEITVEEKIDVLNSNDRTVYVKVEVEREKKPLAGNPEIVVDHYNHRGQHEDYEDLSYGWTIVTVPWVGPISNYEQEYNSGPPCITCKKIDTACALIGDRC